MSLRFRLLRQHGFYVPSDAFRKFKDEKGGFKESLTTDVRGMLAFYEASHVRIHGEDILDEALNFTTAHLRSMATQLSNPLKIQVTHALRFPLHKFFSRLDHWHYISVFENDPSSDKTLLKFAKLDFNLIQSLHKKELSYLTRWWKGQECSTQLSFSRDRMVENYYIYTTTHYEPHYAGFRVAFAKVGTLLTIIDDIYDGYGWIEELEILTKAFERWDRSCIHQLPNYMKPSYKALLEIYEEIEQYLARKGKANCIELIRKTATDVMCGSLQYAKWFRAHCHPPYDEYLTNASTALGCSTTNDCCFIFNGEIPPDEVLEWANQNPKPLQDHAKKCRLLNDLTASGRLRDGTLSTITCYMKHYNVSEEEAMEELHKQLDDFQKDWNKETLRPTVVPVPIMNSLTKLARCAEVLYFNGEDPLAVVTQIHEENITKMFGDPFPV
ncbi:hypothetical protein Ancab_039950 [Ancistrocladus abbreviatus]